MQESVKLEVLAICKTDTLINEIGLTAALIVALPVVRAVHCPADMKDTVKLFI